MWVTTVNKREPSLGGNEPSLKYWYRVKRVHGGSLVGVISMIEACWVMKKGSGRGVLSFMSECCELMICGK